MFSTFIQSTSRAITVVIVLAAFIFISMIAVPHVQAQVRTTTLAELQAQVNALMAQIVTLQAGVTPPVSNLGSLEIGAKVVTTDRVRIRNSAGITAMYVATQPAGSYGVIVGGPVKQDGYTWYKVDYATGPDGWNVGAYLKNTLLVTSVEKGEYFGYMNGKEFVHTLQITEQEATSNCQLYAKSNPGSVVRCTWNGREIFDNQTSVVKATPRFNSVSYPEGALEVNVSTVFGAPTVALTSVTGPVNVGTVNWGDGSAVETVNALISGREATAKLTHSYAKDGVYTITLTGRDGKTAIEKVTVAKTISTTVTPYTLADVKEVTKKTIDPIPTAVDDEYTLYRIVLIGGKVHEVKVGFMPISYRDEQFRKTGYTGDIAKLIAMATVVALKYEINVYSPSESRTYKTGDKVMMEWKTNNLDDQIGSVVLFGNNTERYMLKGIALSKGTATFVIPSSDSLGKIVSGEYKISLVVVGLKDSDPKNVSDSVVIKIVAGSTTVVTAPGKNAFACDRSVATKVASGTLACYGMWDYGDNFGGDKSMCGSLGAPKKGCVIQTPVCVTGAAKATEFFTNDTLTTAKLATISTRLKVTPEVAKDGIAGLWEYTCTSPITAGAVLGASTDIFTEIGKTLGTIGTLLNALK